MDLKGRIVAAATAALGLSACGAREAAPHAIATEEEAAPEEEAEPTVVTAPLPPGAPDRGEPVAQEVNVEERGSVPSPPVRPNRPAHVDSPPTSITGGGGGGTGEGAMCGASCGAGCAGDADEESGD